MDADLDVRALSANEGWNDLSNRADTHPEIPTSSVNPQMDRMSGELAPIVSPPWAFPHMSRDLTHVHPVSIHVHYLSNPSHP